MSDYYALKENMRTKKLAFNFDDVGLKERNSTKKKKNKRKLYKNCISIYQSIQHEILNVNPDNP